MLITCPECEHKISDQAEACPRCGHPVKPLPAKVPARAAPTQRTPVFVIVGAIALVLSLVTPRLLLFFPLMAAFACAVISLFRRERGRLAAIAIFVLGVGVLALDETPLSLSEGSLASGASEGALPQTGGILLEVKSWECHSEYGYMKMSGQVVNISTIPLKDVDVVSQYYGKDNTFVKSVDALIDYNPILPGQTSPFSTMTTGNPAIKKCNLAFKVLFGGSIATKFDSARSK